MTKILVCSVLFSVHIFSQNIFWDRYTIIPPLGTVKSIATSPLDVYAISDDYLLMFDKQTLGLKKTIRFDEDISLVGYDQQYNDLWILGTTHIIRLTIITYSMIQYTFTDEIGRFGVGRDYLYLDGVKDYSLNKKTGELKTIQIFPENIVWSERTTPAHIRKYPFLTPYYYTDEQQESEAPFDQFPITALADDGMSLYVGTRGYGILKYSKISWQKQRIIYGPLDSKIRKVKKFDNTVCFITSQGLSYFPTTVDNWRYRRFIHPIVDFLFIDNKYVIGFENRISRVDGSVIFSISNFTTDIYELDSDEQYIYVGTHSGLFKMYKGTSKSVPFGPDRFPVYAIHATEDAIYVGGEFAFYKYSKEDDVWLKILPYGVKEISEIKDELYLLGVNNQIIKYKRTQGEDLGNIDTNWILLPYFNIYDIDTGNEVLYCASYAGIYYYDPDTELYKVINNLPSIKYDYVFLTDDNIVAVSRGTIYSLSLKYRD